MRPSPDEQRERTPSRRKTTRRWCRGKVGVEHQTVIERDERKPWLTCRHVNPGWWTCNHHEVCTVCGKITDPFPPCPERPA